MVQFLAVVVDDLVGEQADYAAFSLPSTAGSQDVAALALAARSVIRDALSHNVTEAKFTTGLQKMGLPAEAVSALSAVAIGRRGDILGRHRDALPHLLAKDGLQDFDWSVRHVLASDKLSTVGDTLISFSMTVPAVSASGVVDGTKAVAVDLTPRELDALIATLEAAAGVTGETVTK